MIEALKQALEALEDVGVLTDREWQAVHKNKANELRQAIREHAMYEVQRLGQEIEQEPVAFLANAMRFKLSFDSEGKVNCFWNQKELDGRWVALVAAEDDCHLKLTHPPQRTEQNFCSRCGKRTNDIHTCTPPQRKEQEPVAFAGIEMWIGNTRIKKLMTQTELHYAIDPWAIVKFHSDSCIDALKEKNNG
jgi:hypothetical protein